MSYSSISDHQSELNHGRDLSTSPGRQRSFLSARANPLKIERVNSIEYQFESGHWSCHIRRLAQLGFRGAIVGQQGSGKSTLLSQLNSKLIELGHSTHFLFLPQYPFNYTSMLADAIEASTRGSIVLCDGIERLSFLKRRRWLKRMRESGLILTRHQACALPTWIKCNTSAELMSLVLNKLDLGHPNVLAEGQACFVRAGGNIRDALRELYDQFSNGRFSEILSR